mmetsp:Transcript_13913/g.29102  ORF Transcript_13913/g.29102 Transcript_13913/m.29102 type:complete len:96 (+) Transcript_13913:93-380(+)
MSSREAKLVGGTLGGASLGALIGAPAGPIGAIIGFCIGSIPGHFVGIATLNDAEREVHRAQLEAVREANENYEETATDRALEHFVNDTVCPMISG